MTQSLFIGCSINSTYCKAAKFHLFWCGGRRNILTWNMPSFSPVMVDGRYMVPNNGVRLRNHCIDGSKILHNLVGSLQNFIKISDCEVGSVGPFLMMTLLN